MDKDLLIQNITAYARANGESVSHACIAAGAGKSFISDIKRGRMPSLSKFVDLAAYLGVTVSDLVGDNVSNSDTSAKLSPREMRLIMLYRQNPALAPAADKLLGLDEY